MLERLPFTLYKRTLKSGKKVYYAKFLQMNGKYTAGRSTGKANRKAAEIEAWKYISTGRISEKQNIKLKEFSKDFFSWNGDWALYKRSAGMRLSEDHCKRNQSLTSCHVENRIGDLYLTDIDTVVVKNLRNQLYSEGYAGSTINKVLGCLKAILESAEEKRLLRYMPRFERAALNQEERGILTQEEVSELFSLEWTDKRVYAGNLISAATGFRLSEVLGIKRNNIKPGYLEIKGSWSTRTRTYKSGLKNGSKTKAVPIPQSIQTVITELLEESPYKHPDAYLLFCPGYPEKPIEHIKLTKGFAEMLTKLDIPITEELRKSRNISFHSHRHFFNSLLVESRIPLQKIQKLTGHLSPEMTQRYYHTDDLSDVEMVTGEIFNKVIAFRQKAV